MDQAALGLMLQHLRQKRGLTLRELSQLADVDHAYIYRLETGDKERPSDKVLLKLIRALRAGARDAEILHYLAEHTKTEPDLVKLSPLVTARSPTRFSLPRQGVRFAALLGRTTEYWSTGCAEFWTKRKRMTPDEVIAVLKARRFVSRVKPTTIPVPIEPYLDAVGATLRRDTDLQVNEPGWSFATNGKRYICVNAADRKERQRFTICHEIAHAVLGLPSDHGSQPWWSTKRPLEERLCDLFAVELLLPEKLFNPLAEKSIVSFESLDELASQFLVSTTATGSRFAAVISTPIAFVLSEGGKVKYASRSKSLIDANAWIAPQMNVPRDTVSQRARAGERVGREKIDADVWFSDWERGGTLLEEARYLPQWDQTLSLLWFERQEVPTLARDHYERCWDEPMLEELNDYLHWPSRNQGR